MKESWVVVSYDITWKQFNEIVFFYWLFWEVSDWKTVSAVIDECDIASLKLLLLPLGVYMNSKGIRHAQIQNHHELFQDRTQE